MRYGSVCSGIEAATVAWHSLGWQPAWFAEIEPFPSAVLAAHYPNVVNYGDMSKFKEWNDDANGIDLLVGGTPCQSFSVAGLRKGLADPRGNLMLTYLAIAEHYSPRWVVWENVPGVLSSNGGKDFGTFLGALEELGYGWAYRVIDAQYLGVAQRRRRVFVVGYLGDWRRAAAVLFERHSLSGHPAPRREKGQRVAPSLAQSFSGSGGIGYSNQELFSQNGDGLVRLPEDVMAFAQNQRDEVRLMEVAGALASEPGMKQQTYVMAHGQANAEICSERSPALTCNHEAPIACYSLQGAGVTSQKSQGSGWNEDVSFTLNRMDTHGVAYAFEPGIAKREGRDNRFVEECCPTLRKEAGDNSPAVAFKPKYYTRDNDKMEGAPRDDGSIGTLLTGDGHGDNAPCVAHRMQVRRLTPTECERLQGFPDGYTNIPWRGKPESPDGPRYKALGNSMAVPVMHWIGKRIQMVEEITK